MCPGHVPGSRSDTANERSTTLAPASDAKSKDPPLLAQRGSKHSENGVVSALQDLGGHSATPERSPGTVGPTRVAAVGFPGYSATGLSLPCGRIPLIRA